MTSYAALSAQIDGAETHEARRRRTELENSMRQLNTPLPFQPAAHSELARRAVARFAERGVRVSAGENGALIVSPAGQIDAMEREFLQRHKTEILSLLTSFEVL